MLERIVQLFYIPWVFWGVPLAVAVILELVQQWRRRRSSRESSSAER